MTHEVWKPIPGYERYQISNLGRIIGISGKIMKPTPNGKPVYMAVSLQASPTNGLGWRERRSVFKVHRLVLFAFEGPPPEGHEACHRDGDRFNNKHENLYWGTHKQNSADQIKHGAFRFTSPGFGERHHGNKYSDELIEKIRSEYTGKRGEQTALGKKYGIDQRYIYAIVNRVIRKRTTKECYH